MKNTLKCKINLYLLLIIILAISLRLYRIGHHSFWLDEALTVIDSASLKEFIGDAFKDNYPLIFYNFIIHYWLGLGNSEAILRLSSTLFDVFSALLIYFICNLIFNKTVGLFASILLTISPFHIYYSQELRMYSFICFLTLFSTFFLLKILKTNKLIYLLIYSLLNIIGIYTHPVSLLFLITQILFIFLFFKNNGKLIKNLSIAILFIITFIIPFFYLTISSLNFILRGDFDYLLGVNWIPKLKVSILFETIKIFSSGYHALSFSAIAITSIFLSLCFLGFFNTNKNKGHFLLSFSFFLPILFLFLISLSLKSFYVIRYVIASSPFYYMLIANGLFKIGKIGLGILFLISVLIFFPLKNYYMGFEPNIEYRNTGINVKFDDYRGGALYLLNNFKKSNTVLHLHRNTIFPFKYYLNYRYKKLILQNGFTDAILHTNLVLIKNQILEFYDVTYRHNRILKVQNISLQKKNNKIWLVYYPSIDSSEILNLIKREFHLLSEKKFKGFSIYLFDKI